MTDNDIIKALECCTYNITQDKCDKCPLYGGHCTTELARQALDLINRQKAKIDKKDKHIMELQAINESLKADIENFYKVTGHLSEIDRAEAGKEFADKLKAEFREIYNPGFSDLLDRQIDRVLNSVVNSDVN